MSEHTRLTPKHADPGSTEQTCGCFYDSEENSIYLCSAHDGRQLAALLRQQQEDRRAIGWLLDHLHAQFPIPPEHAAALQRAREGTP